MENRGFTLIELLAVIVILGIILGIAVPSVLSIIKKSEIDAYHRNRELIEKTTKTYLTSNTELLPKAPGETKVITLQELINNKLIDAIKDPQDSTMCDSEKSVIKVNNLGNNKFSYETYLSCANYKSMDINVPDIVTEINGSNVVVTAYDDTGFIFDGQDDYISINGTSEFNSGDSGEFTYSVWLKADDYSNFQTFLGRTYQCNNSAHFDLNFTGNKLYFNYYSNIDRQGAYQYSDAILTAGRRYHVVWTKTWGQLGVKLYVNGVVQTIHGDEIVKGYTDSSLPIYIGARNGTRSTCEGDPYPDWFYGGLIYDVQIYNRILSEEEVTKLSAPGVIVDNNGLLAHYEFNDDSNNVLLDKSINNHNGVVHGAKLKSNSGVKRIKIDEGAWIYSDAHTFTGLTTGNHTIYVEDNVGNVATKIVNIP